MSTATHDSEHDHAHDDGAVHAHISPVIFMIGIFAALIFLTVVTVAISYVDLGSANTFVAMLVATMKASLVAAFFMHLRYDHPFNAIIFVLSFLFLGLLMIFSVEDINSRGAIDRANGVQVLERTGARAPGGLPESSLTPPPGHAAGGHAPAAGHAPAGEHH
ncbi:MAG: cytochrome C oxidase subunit IV family protein [Polyangiales bacterium]